VRKAISAGPAVSRDIATSVTIARAWYAEEVVTQQWIIDRTTERMKTVQSFLLGTCALSFISGAMVIGALRGDGANKTLWLILGVSGAVSLASFIALVVLQPSAQAKK
jgi:hypothetical protein